MAQLYIGRFDGYASGSEYGAFNVYFQYDASGITLSNMKLVFKKTNQGKYTTNSYFIDSVSIGGKTYDYSPKSGSANYKDINTGPTINISGTHSSGSSVYVEVKMHRSGQSKGGQTLSGTVTGLATSPTGLWCNITGRTETTVSISGGYTSNGGSGVTSSGYQYSTNGSTWHNCSNYISDLSPGTTYYFRYYARNSVGTSYSGNASTTTYNYPAITSTPNLKIGDRLTIGFSNPRELMCYVYLILADGNEYGGDHTTGTYISGYNDAGWLDHWYNSIPNSKSGTYKVRLYVPDVGINTIVNGGTYSIKNNGTEIPKFSDSDWSYSANLTQLTNNNQCIINGYSEITFSVNTAATSSYGASIVKYVYKWGNQSKDSTLGNTVTGGNNNILQVDAVDSRGLIKTTQKTLTSGDKYVPYNLPSLDYSNCYTHRTDGISNETKLTLRGNLSVMKFGTSGVANAINSVKYRVYDYSTNTWSSQFTIPVSSFTLQTSGYFSLNDYMIHANGTSGGFTTGKRYAVQIILKDASGSLGTLNSSNILVTDGKIARDVYQDSEGNYHQGINGMADSNYTEKIYGDLNVQGNIYSSNNINSKTITATDYGEFPNGFRGKTIAGGAGTSGYFYVFDMTTTDVYQNQFISFDVLQRNRRGHIDLQFKSSGAKGTMEISTIRKQGNIDVYYTNSNNVFSLYIKKSESYDNMEIINLEKSLYMKNTIITWKNITVSSLPSGYVTVTMNRRINDIYPVGSIYMSYKSTSPATLFGGTWEQLKNHFLFATDATSGDKGGYGNGTGTSSGSTTLTAAQSGLPSHQHALQNANPGGTTVGWTNYGVDAITNKGYTGNVRTGYTGGLSASEGHTHTIPYIEVYVWRRTA